ncbi:glutamyl-tRNA reductase [Luteipulveratus mongoliensis]|uniref:Glutamyl-tRNA reductase n=1 Tax=Luteipulveratus mongoliensis TaxID=571913 RepID=A0A0K1JMQ3_9MICO|nr:glutamyl-tRNA reductase [Luteipulveratus mongoliensis]AKU17991.1 glutamyl-tRNA reductase [Luteipulveratus mongoliensis]
MSVIVIGLSHKTASIDTLEQAALDQERRETLLASLDAGEHVGEALLIDTCNRVEVYADAHTFHGAVTEIGESLAKATELPLRQLREHLYVHYEDRAVAHLFSVAAGLDSMAVGESQILGQLRESLRTGRETGRIGSVLDGLVQQALRVGKRAHSETDIDSVSRSLVERGIQQAEVHLGPLSSQRVLVVGAGAMSSLAAHTVSRTGVASLTIINRTYETARRLADATGGQALPFDALAAAIAQADLVISCTGSVGHVIDAHHLPGPQVQHRQAYVDLALPRDVAPEVAERVAVEVMSLAHLGSSVEGSAVDQVRAVQDLVTGEVADFLIARRAASVAPTVALLRSRAADVVAAELSRLQQRVPGLTEADQAQVQLTVHRVVEKLLHTPTVRVKQLAGEGQDYTTALRELFDLDPRDTATVSTPPAPKGLQT